MSLCRVMLGAHLHGWPRVQDGRELFDSHDLVVGAQYAGDYLAVGIQFDPLDGFDLAAFKAWCEALCDRLKGEKT